MKTFFKAFVTVFVIGIIILVITSCAPTHQLTNSQTSSVKVKDSIIYKETVKWDTVYIPGSSTEVEIPVAFIDTASHAALSALRSKVTLYQSHSNQANLTVKDSNNHLTIHCTCDSFKAVIAAKNTEIENLKTSSQSSSQTLQVPVRYTAWYDIACRWIAGLLILLIILFILIKRFL